MFARGWFGAKYKINEVPLVQQLQCLSEFKLLTDYMVSIF